MEAATPIPIAAPCRQPKTRCLNDAGYANERLVLLHASDFAPVHTMWQVIAVRLAEAGFNVDDQVMDQATVVTRRNNREAPDKGGWSLLIANAPAADHLSPMVAHRRCRVDWLADRSSGRGVAGAVDR